MLATTKIDGWAILFPVLGTLAILALVAAVAVVVRWRRRRPALRVVAPARDDVEDMFTGALDWPENWPARPPRSPYDQEVLGL